MRGGHVTSLGPVCTPLIQREEFGPRSGSQCEDPRPTKGTHVSDIKVLVLVGSLRAASINRQLAELAIESAPDGVRAWLVRPAGGVAVLQRGHRQRRRRAGSGVAPAAADADAALVVTPEYNGSIPGVLKNAIDWLSRPFGNSALKDKPMAVIGAALGQYGGVWAHDETRKSFGIAGRGGRGFEAVVPAKVVRRQAPAGERRGRRDTARHRRQAGRRGRLIEPFQASRRPALAETRRRLCCCVTVTFQADGRVGGRW